MVADSHRESVVAGEIPQQYIMEGIESCGWHVVGLGRHEAKTRKMRKK